MNSFLIYIVQVSTCLVVFYLVFWLFFRKLSFHGFNRIFLISILVGSFIIPQLEVDFNPEIAKEFTFSEFEDLPFSEPVFSESVFSEISAQPNRSNSLISFSNLLSAVYLAGVIFCLSRFIYSVSNLFKLRKGSSTKSEEKFTLISIQSNAPFSFFRWIFLPTDFYENGSPAILSHEKAHGTLWHSADLLLLELAKALLWFNPIIYLFRKSLKSTHEFQADSQVLKSEIQTSDYLMLLLKSIERQNSVGLYSYFQNSQLKQRIEMMTNPKSRKTQLLKYLFIFPIAIFMAIAFSKENRQQTETPSLAFIGDQQFMMILKDHSIPAITPIENNLYKSMTSGYGMRKDPISKTEKLHTGMDFSAKEGIKVRATADGVIVKVESSEEGHGKRIIIDHGNGIMTGYSHLNDFNVKLGDKVEKREVIGFVGSTWTSFGSHLHYEVIKDGEKVDPKDYMKGVGQGC